MAKKVQKNPIKIIRRPQVEARTGLSRSTIYLKMKKGEFPKPVKLGERSVGWIESEIDALLASHLEKRDSEQKIDAK